LAKSVRTPRQIIASRAFARCSDPELLRAARDILQELREARREADVALVVAHKFAGDVALWANHPAKATAADYEAVRVEALRIRDLLFDALEGCPE
jgi:hypothetical protein